MARKITSSDYVLNNNGDPYNNGEDQPNAGPVQGYDPSQGGIDANPPDDGGVDQPIGSELGPPVDQGTGWQGNEGQTGDPTGTGKTPVGDVPPVTHDPATPVATTPESTLKDTVYSKLTALLNRDPSNNPASAAYRTAQQRQQERDRALTAERDAANGLAGSGAFESQLAGLNQRRGENEAAFDANQANVNDQTVLQALGLGGNLYGGDLNRDLNASQFESGQNSQLIQWILQQLAAQGAGAV